MRAEEIEIYLAELGSELQTRGVTKPLRVLLIGGAYMLLVAHSPRPTDDVDFFWVEESVFQETLSQKTFTALNDSIQVIAGRYALDPGWFNYFAQMLMFDEVRVPKGRLWKRFGPLHIYISKEEMVP